MPDQEAPLGTEIQGTTTAPGHAGLGGKSVALNLQKRAFFRFADRDDFELTAGSPSGILPKDLSAAQSKAIILLINRKELVRGTKPLQITRKKLDRVKPYLLFVQQSSNFAAIKRRITEVAGMGGNVKGSGYSAREVLEMMTEQELESHARNDVLNLLDRVLAGLPGNNLPHDEPGTHAVRSTTDGGRADFGVTEEPAAQPGSRSAREAIGRKAGNADISSL
jgi:hypothetical protein